MPFVYVVISPVKLNNSAYLKISLYLAVKDNGEVTNEAIN